MRRFYSVPVILVLLLLAFAPGVAYASDPPYVAHSTIPVDDEVKAVINSWLAVSAPSAAPYYSITYFQVDDDLSTFVSLVGLDLADPSQDWNLTNGHQVTWRGSVKIFEDGTVEMISHNRTDSARSPRFARPRFDGGGSHLSFPWSTGKSMMYGQNGVHDAFSPYAVEYVAVDFVGGDDMGSGVAGPNVYASTDGEIEYVCEDATTTAVEVYNDVTGDHILYAHLLDNANLVLEHEFAKGEMVGSLKYGSFDDECGYASQASNHYHLHYEFIPSASNTFRIEGCVLNTTSQKWTCGTTSVSPGQFLRGGYGGTGLDDSGVAVAQPNFWDSFLSAVTGVYKTAIVDNMPDHSAIEFTHVIYNSVKITLRIARVMVYSNVNLAPLALVVVTGFGIKILFGLAEFIVFLFKAWKSLVPIVGA